MTQAKRKPAKRKPAGRKPRRQRPVPATALMLGYFAGALGLMAAGRAWWVSVLIAGGVTTMLRWAVQ